MTNKNFWRAFIKAMDKSTILLMEFKCQDLWVMKRCCIPGETLRKESLVWVTTTIQTCLKMEVIRRFLLTISQMLLSGDRKLISCSLTTRMKIPSRQSTKLNLTVNTYSHLFLSQLCLYLELKWTRLLWVRTTCWPSHLTSIATLGAPIVKAN